MTMSNQTEAAWKAAYVNRMVMRGVDREVAEACADAGEVDLAFDPADAADDELSCWTDDGDGPHA